MPSAAGTAHRPQEWRTARHPIGHGLPVGWQHALDRLLHQEARTEPLRHSPRAALREEKLMNFLVQTPRSPPRQPLPWPEAAGRRG